MTTDPTPTEKARRAFLVDIDHGSVADDHTLAPHLSLPNGERARVADAVWQLERDGLVYQPPGSYRWELTDAGRAALEAGA